MNSVGVTLCFITAIVGAPGTDKPQIHADKHGSGKAFEVLYGFGSNRYSA